MAKGILQHFKKVRKPKEKDASLKNDQEQLQLQEKIIAVLKSIDLKSPYILLSQEKIEEYRIDYVIQFCLCQIDVPSVSETDFIGVDRSILSYATALKQAVMEGLETAANWSCTALTTAFRCLRIDAPWSVLSVAHTQHYDYLLNLELLVNLCVAHDRICHNLQREIAHRTAQEEKLARLTADYRHRRENGLLDGLLDEVRKKINSPSSLSDEASALVCTMNEINHLKKNLEFFKAKIETQRAELNVCKQHIDYLVELIIAQPIALDPDLTAKMNVTTERYIQYLKNKLSYVERGHQATHDIISMFKDASLTDL